MSPSRKEISQFYDFSVASSASPTGEKSFTLRNNFSNINSIKKMKKIYIPFILAIAGFFALSNSNGAGTVQGNDRTGSPVGNGSCQTCHNAGAFNPSAVIEILSGDNPVTEYEPGAQYTMRITTTTTGSPASYGFQAVALDGANATAGAWGSGTGYKTVSVSGRSYAEQDGPGTSNVYNITWTAPATGAGDVSFYAATSSTNGNGATSGDNGAVAPMVTLAEDAGSSVANQGIGKMELTVMPNPVGSSLTYKAIGRDNGNYHLQITDAFGKVVKVQTVNLITGENQNSIDVSDLAKGVYILQISGKDYYAAERMLKL